MRPASHSPARRNIPAAGVRVTIAMLGGAVTGLIATFFTLPAAAILIGWDVAAGVYLTWLWSSLLAMDPDVTAQLAKREDPSRALAEIAVVSAGTAMLVAVGFALLRAGEAAGAVKAYLVGLGVLSVVLSWTVVHTVYMLRYARAFYSPPTGGIEFNESEPPSYVDFAYFSFTVGMTFQVSDTNITSRQIRRLTFHHALLSYLFGAVILALAINVVASLFH
jgi:uncharacterized membrane protein